MYQTTIIFGIMKEVSLLMHSSASFNCFTLKYLFQNGANDVSQMVNIVNDFLSKSFKFSVARTSTTWHPLNIKLTNRIESMQRFACRVILQQWKLSHDELLQESDLPAKRCDVATLCHLFKIFHGLCSSPNPYSPHPRPSLRHLNSCAVGPSFCRLSLSKTSFYPYAPTLWNYLPEAVVKSTSSKPSNWPSTPTFFSQFCLCLFPAILFCFFCLFGMFLYFFVHFFPSFLVLMFFQAILQFIVRSILDSPGLSRNVINKEINKSSDFVQISPTYGKNIY